MRVTVTYARGACIVTFPRHWEPRLGELRAHCPPAYDMVVVCGGMCLRDVSDDVSLAALLISDGSKLRAYENKKLAPIIT